MVKNSIKVYARLKQEDDRRKIVKYQIYRRADHEDISFPISSTTDVRHKNRKYRFCKIFDQVSTQTDIFDTVAKPIINSVINGFNGTIFAYGQTGSGKTYSITGSPSEYNERGILPRSIEHVFELTKTSSNLYNVYVSYLEIYNENGYDLLNSKCHPSRLEELPRVILLEDANGEAHLRNLSVLPVANEQEAMRLLFLGDTNRTIAETPMNEYSSRSHCIFTVYINNRNETGEKLRRSKLHLVDLAGSERIRKTKISGVTLKEAKHINLSLHYLEQVILALSQPNRTHIPYRNSMMTYILRDSLSGNSLTIMLATLALSEQNQPETLTTCRFAQRVACISTDAIINEEVDPQQEIQFLKAELDELHRRLAQAKDENADKPLTFQDIEKCKRIADNFLVADNETILDNLNNMELRCCLKHLKANFVDKLSDKTDNHKMEEDLKVNLTTKYNDIIKEKDDEISILTQLLQTNEVKMISDHRVNSAPTLATNPFGDLKRCHPTSERNLFDTFIMETTSKESIPQIKKSLLKKYDLARSVSKTVQKCQENITDLREKLAKEPMGTEMSEKLHNFLISQQKIYKESLGQLENLKSETDFLKESLKRAENKIMVKLKSAVKNKTKEDDYKRTNCTELSDFLAKLEGNNSGFHTVVNPAKKNTNNYLVESLSYRDLPIKDISRKSDTTPFINENGDYDPGLENLYITCAKVDNYHHQSVPSLLTTKTESFESLPPSSRSRTGSGYSTSRSQNEDIQEQSHKSESSHNLIHPDDTPAFLEFMKTIPLTGDLEVDDEIFKFYRTKFKN